MQFAVAESLLSLILLKCSNYVLLRSTTTLAESNVVWPLLR